MLVKNSTGTSDLKLPNNESWIHYWEKQKGRKLEILEICPACHTFCFSCQFDGAHVQKVNDRSGALYIAPLCDSCNHRTDTFDIPEDLLVPVPKVL